jgi:hypothetical protein
MNTEQKIAFRSLISDVLMHMMEKGRSPGEILEVQQKLDDSVVKLINNNLQAMMPGPVYLMGPADKTEWRVLIAGTLYSIGQPECNPSRVMEMIKGLEKWIEDVIERTLRHYVGKPKMTIHNRTTGRKTDLPN